MKTGSLLVAGIDVGSLYTKAVILNGKGEVTSFSILPSGAAYQEAAKVSFSEALNKAGVASDEISYMVATGYGRAIVPFANIQVTEISCHARGARWIFPGAHTVIDIGGQDIKAISLGEKGQVIHFVMNDKCAAGTGRFLEVMAATLGVSLEGLSELSAQPRHQVEVSSICTVFAESEVISLLARGGDKRDIAAAVFEAIARRIVALVGQVGIKERVVMTGGVAKSPGMVKALERKLNTTILVPQQPQITGALGAALIAAERLSF